MLQSKVHKHCEKDKSRYKRGVCRPLEEESSFCLGLSTRPVSEIVPVCLNPRYLVLITLCCDEVSRGVAFVFNSFQCCLFRC